MAISKKDALAQVKKPLTEEEIDKAVSVVEDYIDRKLLNDARRPRCEEKDVKFHGKAGPDYEANNDEVRRRITKKYEAAGYKVQWWEPQGGPFSNGGMYAHAAEGGHWVANFWTIGLS